jgi:hypothetical protein
MKRKTGKDDGKNTSPYWEAEQLFPAGKEKASGRLEDWRSEAGGIGSKLQLRLSRG